MRAMSSLRAVLGKPATLKRRKQVLENEDPPLTWLSSDMNVVGAQLEQCSLASQHQS